MRIRLLFSSPELFAKNVQLRLAEALSLPSTDITFTKYYNDYCAQHNLIDNNKATTSSGSSNHHSQPSQSGDSHSDPSQKKVLWTTSLSTFVLDERENQIIYCLCGGSKTGGTLRFTKCESKCLLSLEWSIQKEAKSFSRIPLVVVATSLPKGALGVVIFFKYESCSRSFACLQTRLRDFRYYGYHLN